MALESQRARELLQRRFAMGQTAWESSIAPMSGAPLIPQQPGFTAPQVASTPQFPRQALPAASIPQVSGPAIPMGSGMGPQLPSPPTVGTMGARPSIGVDWLRAQAAGGGPGAMASTAAPPAGMQRPIPASPTPAARAPFVADPRAGAAMARGVNPTLPFQPAGGVRAAAGQAFKWPGVKGGLRNSAMIGLPIALLRGSTDEAFSQGSLADRAAEGAATGGELGSFFGPVGAAVGAAGVGLGDTLAGLLPWTKDKESVSQMISRFTGGFLGTKGEGGGGGTGQPQREITFQSMTPVFDAAGLSPEMRKGLEQEWKLSEEIHKAAGTWDDQAKMELQMTMMQERLPSLMMEDQARQRALQSQIAMQGLVSEYFGGENGLVERMRQSGQARGDAMAALSGQLPAHLAPAANFMAQDARASGDQLAAAYEAQIRMLPTYNAMTQYQQELQGIASQVHNQGVQGVLGQGGGTDPLADPSALMAQELMSQLG